MKNFRLHIYALLITASSLAACTTTQLEDAGAVAAGAIEVTAIIADPEPAFDTDDHRQWCDRNHCNNHERH
jgi:hypothetical protein